MPYRIDFKANVIQIIGDHFYTAIDTLYVVLTINGSLWNLRPMVILTKLCHFSAIALMFGILILKIDINTQFH